MIVRIWRGAATVENAPTYLKHVTEKVFPSLSDISGYQGANLLQREIDGQIEFLAVTMWDSIEAIKGFAGNDVRSAIVEPAAQTVLTEFDHFANHYELVYGSGCTTKK
jgi:heme-degrading monooxygenase HmoA